MVERIGNQVSFDSFQAMGEKVPTSADQQSKCQTYKAAISEKCDYPIDSLGFVPIASLTAERGGCNLVRQRTRALLHRSIAMQSSLQTKIGKKCGCAVFDDRKILQKNRFFNYS
jgi:hypothetical protein